MIVFDTERLKVIKEAWAIFLGKGYLTPQFYLQLV